MKIIYVKICPKCGSTNIKPFTKMGLSEGEMFIDHCKNCYYGMPFGGLFPEIDVARVKDFQEEIKMHEEKGRKSHGE
jgi:hypothetical protein